MGAGGHEKEMHHHVFVGSDRFNGADIGTDSVQERISAQNQQNQDQYLVERIVQKRAGILDHGLVHLVSLC